MMDKDLLNKRFEEQAKALGIHRGTMAVEIEEFYKGEYVYVNGHVQWLWEQFKRTWG